MKVSLPRLLGGQGNFYLIHVPYYQPVGGIDFISNKSIGRIKYALKNKAHPTFGVINRVLPF